MYGFDDDNVIDNTEFDDDYIKSLKIENERDKVISLGVLSIIVFYMFILCVYYYKTKYYQNTDLINISSNNNINNINESFISTCGTIILLDDDNIIHYFENECSICYNEFNKDTKVVILNNCSHGFHLDCIVEWFKQDLRCPLCNNVDFSNQTV